jgi:hypothetical protein
MPLRGTLVVVVSRSNFEALVACMVLAHLRATFHPCTCGFRGGADVIAAARNHMEVAADTSTREGDLD